MRSRVFLAIFALLAFPACSLLPETGGGASTEINKEHLTQHWVHAYEKEPEGSEVEIYRPNGYKDFPASRFRMQYIFEDGGGCEWFYLAPNDAHHFKPGTWWLDADEEDVIHIEQGDETVSYHIVELAEDLLRMRRIG